MGNRSSKKHKRDGWGSWGMTPAQVDDFYARWREWCVVASTRGATIVANSAHEGFMKDLGARLKEDQWWIMRSLPAFPMLFMDEVPYDALFFHTEERGMMTPAELINSGSGFGRMNAMAPSKDGVRPWDTIEGAGEVITPDDS